MSEETPEIEATEEGGNVGPVVIPDDAVEKLIALALNPKEGESFEFGGKTFHRQFLTMDGEMALLGLITRVTEAMPSSSIAESFLLSVDHMLAAIAIILQDQDPECDEDWVRQVRGPKLVEKMTNIFLAQIQLQEMVPALGKLLAFAGLAHVVAAKASPNHPGSPLTA